MKLNFDLPQDLVERLTAAGLLNDAGIARLLTGALASNTGEESALTGAYRTLFEQTHDAVFIIAPTGLNIAVNHRAAELTGFSMEELLTMTFRQLSTELAESSITMMNLLGGRKVPPYERWFRTKSGTIFPAEVSAQLVSDEAGRPQYIQSVVRDITERKSAEKILRDSEQFLREIIDAVPHHIFAKVLDGRYILANKATAQAYGTTTENLLGKYDADFAATPEEAAIFTAQDRQVIEGGTPLIVSEEDFTDGQGRKRILRTTKIPLMFPGSDTPAVLGVSTDITEIKQAAVELRHAYRHAYDLAAERQRVQILTQFVQDSSHEFRTPLSIIGTSVYLMTRTSDPERRSAHAAQATEQIDRMIRLLDHLQTMADLDSGVPLEIGTVNVNVMLNEVIGRLVKSPDKHDLAIHLTLDNRLPDIQGDVFRLSQAFEYVLDNAVRFTLPDGSIAVTTWAREDTVVIEVRDSGVGIAPEHLPNVTRRFWRLDEARTTPGFGLGLPIVQKIVERHNGEMTIYSEPGNGTLVTLVLPRSSENGK